MLQLFFLFLFLFLVVALRAPSFGVWAWGGLLFVRHVAVREVGLGVGVDAEVGQRVLLGKAAAERGGGEAQGLLGLVVLAEEPEMFAHVEVAVCAASWAGQVHLRQSVLASGEYWHC